ncbi:hypothetical protein C5167_001740 [Papaver somniferum]|uniref:Uncharacterized protein n=1 Tax=Papaver somniferum TaxID=3469 RepID=A0A4Y7KW43_PAPSO|nr:hypothetical protein C5167_001740 [Papaver somniferum]
MPHPNWDFYKIDPSDYCSNTVFEDATPELVRNFFWDEDFRSNQDAILCSYILRRKRNFLFLHNDREYIIDEYGKQEDHIGVAKSLQFDVIKC